MLLYPPNTPDVLVTPRDPAYPAVHMLPLQRHDLTVLGSPDARAAEFLMSEDLSLYADPDKAWDHFRNGPGFVWGVHRVVGEQALELVGVAVLWKEEGVTMPAIGAGVFRNEHLGLGLGSTMFMGAIDCAYQRTGSNVVCAETVVANRPCTTMLRKLGLVPILTAELSLATYGPQALQSLRTYWVGCNSDTRAGRLATDTLPPETMQLAQARHAVARARYNVEYS